MAGGPGAIGFELQAHDLRVELDPNRHRLLATDRIELRVLTPQLTQLSFSLSAALQVQTVHERRGAKSRPLDFASSRPPQPNLLPSGEKAGMRGDEAGSVQQVTVHLSSAPEPGQLLNLEWDYEGTINDPPRDRGQLRFVIPSETTGHIGPDGVYLSGETHWYPDVPRSLSTYRIRVITPEGWEAVTHGTQLSRVSQERSAIAEWDVTAPTEGLTLVANRFVKAQRTWKDPSGRLVEVATYLLPDNAPLAAEYLDASVRYLDTYAALLGPYPFPKFAVVENFFASGLGMPSFTLLGGGVIKRHYVQPYALGHEIVHSWIGNFVFNDVTGGNWVEGLTTYLANYYYEELAGPPEKAREERRMMLAGYAVYVRPDEDYPVGRFQSKRNQKDNAIGYQKAAMVFHMLRREIGDAAFFGGIRTLVAQRGGTYANWADLSRAFSDSARQDLRWFFTQWVDRAGAPELRVKAVQVEPDGTNPNHYHVRFRLSQAQPTPYRLKLQVVLAADGREESAWVAAGSADESLRATVSIRPDRLVIDPGFEVFRRLAREELPPMLNLFVTDRERTVVTPSGGTDAERQPYRELAARATKQDADAPAPITSVDDRQAVSPDRSVLVLGGPGMNALADWAVRGCGNRVQIKPNGFQVNGQRYEGPGMALLVSCRIPERPAHIATLFYGTSPQVTAQVARLLFFYGWQSYLVFRDGKVVARGDFGPSADPLEVQLK